MHEMMVAFRDDSKTWHTKGAAAANGDGAEY